MHQFYYHITWWACFRQNMKEENSRICSSAAFELGRHEWFALRRVITNSRSSAFTGSFLKLFLKETSQADGRNKNWTMQRLLHGTLRLRYCPNGEQIQNGRTADEIPRDPITPWCGPQLFCPCFSLAETVLKILLFPFTKYSSCLLTYLSIIFNHVQS